ncbi:MAG: hypothetical protein OEZ34_14095 [Spirochaetia bacterium]|nr:hypothetical protein [Spirochaetia bacterium]
MILFAFCTVKNKEPVRSGVKIIKQETGPTLFIATARASKASLQKSRRAMMQTTSCDAAKLLLKKELKHSGMSFNQITITEAELLEKGEFCRITAEY